MTALSKREEASTGIRNQIMKFWLSISGGDDEDQDLAVCSPEYGPQVKMALSTMGEKDMSFELIEAILKYIASMNAPGAVLVFLPGWNIIFALMKWLQQHQLFGGPQYRIIPLHSQLPRLVRAQFI